MSRGPGDIRETYDRLVGEAFCFLVKDYGYTAKSTIFAESRDQSTTTAFEKGQRRIEFRQCLDSQFVSDLLFLPGDFKSFVSPDRSVIFIDYRRFSIHRVMAKLALPALPMDGKDLEAIVRRYAGACRDHAKDLVEGDFSLFGQNTFVVEQVDKRAPSQRVVRGVFSSLNNAQTYSQKAHSKMPAMAEVQFEISLRELDFQDVD